MEVALVGAVPAVVALVGAAPGVAALVEVVTPAVGVVTPANGSFIFCSLPKLVGKSFA